jgi:hypothetical protein
MTPDAHGHASSPGSKAFSGPLDSTQSSATNHSDAESDGKPAFQIRDEDSSVIQVIHRFKPAVGLVADIKGLQNASQTKDCMESVTATVGVQCPRPQPTGTSGGYGMNTQINNDNGSRSDEDEGQSDHNDDQGNNGQGDDEPEEDGDGDGSGDGPTNLDNTRAHPTPNGPLGCPYRKRNKSRFNIRHYLPCTKPFKDISAVK